MKYFVNTYDPEETALVWDEADPNNMLAWGSPGAQQQQFLAIRCTNGTVIPWHNVRELIPDSQSLPGYPGQDQNPFGRKGE